MVADQTSGPYDSPVFDIQHGNDSVQSQNAVKVGEETIEIVPHPTTNRYPWVPVDNPTVDVYETVTRPPVVSTQSATPPVPISLPSPPPAIASPPLAPTPPVIPTSPIATITPPPPITVVVPPVVVLPPPPPAPAVVQQPPPAVPPIVVEAATYPVARQPVTEPNVELPPRPMPVVKPHQGHQVKIYSDYTRQVWKVLRPSKLLKTCLALVGLAIVVIVIVTWMQSGASLNPFELPFLRNLIVDNN